MKKRSMIILLTALLSTGFLSTSIISFLVSRMALIDLIRSSQLPLTSDNIYSEIQRDLLKPVFIASLMADDTFLRDWVISGEKDSRFLIKYLKEINSKYGTFTSFFISDKTLAYYNADGILKKIDRNDGRDIWYFRLKEKKDIYEINVDPDTADMETMTIFINYKVFDYSGNYMGVTGIGLNVSRVKALIRNYQINYNCRIYFTDNEGNVVLRGPSNPADNDDEEKAISEIPGLSGVFKKIISGEVTKHSYDYGGKTVHLNARRISEFGWYLFVEQAEFGSLKGVLSALFINLAICLVMTAAILFLSNFTLSLYQNKIEKMAVTDNLTGAYNRHILDVSLNFAFNEYSRYKKPFSVLMLDIDDFKKINDRYGHLAGDGVLCSLTGTIGGIIRNTDILSRWGGEEFMVLLNDCRENDAYDISEKIRIAIDGGHTTYEGREIHFTVSLGISEVRKDDKAKDIISRSDYALYSAKQKGKNRTVIG